MISSPPPAVTTGRVLQALGFQTYEELGLRVLAALLLLLACLLLSRWAVRRLSAALQRSDGSAPRTLVQYEEVLRVALIGLGVCLALHTLGLNLAAIFTTGGLLAVALGFAMKDLASNLVAGLILQLERTIRIGDVLDTDHGLVRVIEIGLRSTVASSLAGEHVLIPNGHLSESVIMNRTHGDSFYCISTVVGVAHDSDMDLVRRTLLAACEAQPWSSPHRSPGVSFTELADSSVGFWVGVWTEDPWAAAGQRAQLLASIWSGLQEAGIEIPFPQRDVHLRPAPAAGESPGA